MKDLDEISPKTYFQSNILKFYKEKKYKFKKNIGTKFCKTAFQPEIRGPFLGAQNKVTDIGKIIVFCYILRIYEYFGLYACL